MNGIDTATIRAAMSGPALFSMHGDCDAVVHLLCDALDEARAERDRWRGDYEYALGLGVDTLNRAVAAEAELEERWTLVRQRDDAMAERDQWTDRAVAAEAERDELAYTPNRLVKAAIARMYAAEARIAAALLIGHTLTSPCDEHCQINNVRRALTGGDSDRA